VGLVQVIPIGEDVHRVLLEGIETNEREKRRKVTDLLLFRENLFEELAYVIYNSTVF